MRLSTTSEGTEWLAQFESGDRAVAARLIDDLIVITPGEFDAGMRKLLREEIDATQGAIAFYPIWDIERDTESGEASESLFDLPQAPALGNSPTTTGSSHQIAPRRAISGSVGVAVTLISDLVKENNRRLLDRPRLNSLKATKCHRIVLVDDLIGSGQRAKTFLQAFYMHPTIKSWCSFPGLDVAIVCYAASSIGLRAVSAPRTRYELARPPAVRVNRLLTLPYGRAAWTADELASMMSLCRKYARFTRHDRIPLGVGDSFSMILFPHTITNTAPPILWSTSRQWKPLFPNRVVPDALRAVLTEIRADPAGTDLAETLQRMGQMRLANGDWTQHATPLYKQLIAHLALRAKGVRDVAIISDTMAQSESDSRALQSKAQLLGFLDPAGRLTSRGLAELRYARTVGELPWEAPALDEHLMYFPQSLRGGQRSI